MKPNLLAIVIPAYKAEFLYSTLESISNQSCKDFVVYIGDDSSPNELNSIVSQFEEKIDLQYKRFNENLGRNDLVAQWERCIEMVQDEKWIWLFSDDDIMDKNCVEKFYEELNNSYKYPVYHFNINIIDKDNYITNIPNDFPNILSSSDFFEKRVKGFIYSFVVEYIFSKEVYYSKGKFPRFDLAWNTDDAFWITLGADKGIKTIMGASVSWRMSSLNITSQKTEKFTLLRKMESNLAYSKWLLNIDLFNDRKYKSLVEERYINKLIVKSKSFNVMVIYDFLRRYNISFKLSKPLIYLVFKILAYRCYIKFKSKLSINLSLFASK
jgi:glycosyltransferase involved in cell wall biosynthesis